MGLHMPTLVIIEGIKISMFDRDHEPPHVHVLTADADVMFDIRTATLIDGYGRLTRREFRLVTAWLEENRVALLARWAAR